MVAIESRFFFHTIAFPSYSDFQHGGELQQNDQPNCKYKTKRAMIWKSCKKKMQTRTSHVSGWLRTGTRGNTLPVWKVTPACFLSATTPLLVAGTSIFALSLFGRQFRKNEERRTKRDEETKVKNETPIDVALIQGDGEGGKEQGGERQRRRGGKGAGRSLEDRKGGKIVQSVQSWQHY